MENNIAINENTFIQLLFQHLLGQTSGIWSTSEKEMMSAFMTLIFQQKNRE